MFSKTFLVATAITVFATVAQGLPQTARAGARVQFYTTRDSCGGTPSEDYQNVKCNTCIDPAGGTSESQCSQPLAIPFFVLQASVADCLAYRLVRREGVRHWQPALDRPQRGMHPRISPCNFFLDIATSIERLHHQVSGQPDLRPQMCKCRTHCHPLCLYLLLDHWDRLYEPLRTVMDFESHMYFFREPNII